MDGRRLQTQPYAWVVLAAAFVGAVFAFGGAKSFGVFYVEFLEKYEEGSGSTAWIASVSMGLMLAFGIPSSWLCEMFSARAVMVTGGAIAALGHVISAYVTRMEWLYLTYGVITGIGRGMCFTPSLLMVNTYFVQRRALANGIFAAGSGVGSFALPFITRLLLDNYGLDGALLVFTGITLNLCVCGALMRPFRPMAQTDGQVSGGIQTGRRKGEMITHNDSQHDNQGPGDEKKDSTNNHDSGGEKDISGEVSIASKAAPQHECCADSVSITLTKNTFNDGKDFQTTVDTQSKSLEIISVDLEKDYLNIAPVESLNESSIDEDAECLRRPSDHVLIETTHKDCLYEKGEHLDKASFGSVKKSRSENDLDREKDYPDMFSLSEKCIVEGRSTEITLVNSQLDARHIHTTGRCSDSEISTSINWDTKIQITGHSNGSLVKDETPQLSVDEVHQTLEELRTMDSSQTKEAGALAATQSILVTPALHFNQDMNELELEKMVANLNGNLNTDSLKCDSNDNIVNAENSSVILKKTLLNDIQLNDGPTSEDSPFIEMDYSKSTSGNAECQGCIVSWFKGFKAPRVDISILSYPVFLIYELAFMSMIAGYLTNFIMLPAHAVHIGFTKPQADLLLSIVGIADIVGRMFFGWFSDLHLLSRGKLTALLAFLGCVSSMLLPLSRNYAALCAYAVSVGFIIGAGGIIVFVLLTESIGNRLTPNVIGIHSTIFAIPALLGPPLAGWLKDRTGSWDTSFRVAGGCLLVSMVITLWIGPLVVRKVDKKEEGK